MRYETFWSMSIEYKIESINMKINKWKIFGYTVITWLGFSILARILVELEPRPYFTIIDGQGVVWGWMSLFMGLYLAVRFKKWIELVWGVALFFICTLPVVGMLIGIGYFARAYVKLEGVRLVKLGVELEEYAK